MSPDGSVVFVTGSSFGVPTNDDYATVAYDVATGSRRWVSGYNGPGNEQDHATALGVSPDGSTVFVTGWSWGALSEYDYATVALDAATGAKRWVSRYDGPGNRSDTATAMAVSPDGSTVFVTGYDYAETDYLDYATVALDAVTGVRRWVDRYDGPANFRDSAYAIGVSPDGSTVFVTGGSDGVPPGIDYATVAIEASTGTEQWVSRYAGPGNGYATALAVGPDGSTVFATGRSWAPASAWDFATVAIDVAAGTQRWVSRYNGPGNDWDNAAAVAVGPDGSTVFVTGNSIGHAGGRYDFATVALDAASGGKRWVTRYTGPGDHADSANAIGLSPDGSTVYLTGESETGSVDSDYATLALDGTSGAKLWLSRYNGRDFGAATALGLSPDGLMVFVTGQSGHEYATVAYSAS